MAGRIPLQRRGKRPICRKTQHYSNGLPQKSHFARVADVWLTFAWYGEAMRYSVECVFRTMARRHETFADCGIRTRRDRLAPARVLPCGTLCAGPRPPLGGALLPFPLSIV